MKDIAKLLRRKEMKLKLIGLIFISLWLSACATKETGKPSLSDQIQQIEAQQAMKPDFEMAAKINAQLGIDYLNKNLLDLAKQKIVKAQGQDDSLAVVHYAMGLYYSRVGNKERAEDAFEKALDIEPENYQALSYYGQFLCQQEDFKEAESYFDESLSLQSNNRMGATYELYGVCVLKYMRDPKRATILFHKALLQNPKLTLSYYLLAETYADAGEFHKADEALNLYLKYIAPSKASLELELKIAKGLIEPNRVATIQLILNSKY